MTRQRGVNEWNDPYKIIDTDDPTTVPDERKQAILEAIITAYDDQHTTTPLDANTSFRLEGLTPVDDSSGTEYKFEVQRFIGGTPAKRHAGHVHRTDDEWEATYEDQSLGSGFLDSVRNLLPYTSPE
ncbi:hypothetical protein B4589_004445 [Halolamina sp. CBA1230]|uniref:hypothetical protein n=1 Tax=Halolamina sp. CBA1230 TaxID=1853690 RepID=UPI0009A1CD62|nr:hypothetical protein [Halolamina sp. CBA1230]QKY19665.1 hypothetical protein B4589_004445 [Halolamina sp. CBA1230]